VAFLKSISRFLSPAAKPAPALHLAAFGKHPGWNDHLDDLGLDTAPLVNAKRLLYIQGISQNIDSGAWDKLEDTVPSTDGTPLLAPIARLDLFRHDFLWYMPGDNGPDYLAGRLWSSSDGKGRAKYPMLLCSQLVSMPDRFATHIVMPILAQVHEKCAAATSAQTVRDVVANERENLRSHLKDTLAVNPLTPRQLAAVATHRDMQEAGAGIANEGFDRIVYQFARGMSTFRAPANKSATSRRPEQVRLPACGMSSRDALLFYLRFALTFVDPSTPLLLISPDQSLSSGSATSATTTSATTVAPWVDLIAGEPTPSNLFCIKAGTKSLPFTSDIPYTLDPSLTRAIDAHLATCTSAPDSAPLPPWPMFQ